MQTYISILRAINVGHRKILMTDLKALYEELKLKEVITYIQSGNVIFKTDKKIADQSLAKKIEQAITKKYHFDVPVIIRTVDEMKKTITANPFLKQRGINLEKMHVTFLAENPEPANVKNIENLDYTPDKFIIMGKEIYLYCPNGYGITKLSNGFFENKLKVTATTRNWKTVNTLATLAIEK
jgi:uncharacterized protein (DUF1697 family)